MGFLSIFSIHLKRKQITISPKLIQIFIFQLLVLYPNIKLISVTGTRGYLGAHSKNKKIKCKWTKTNIACFMHVPMFQIPKQGIERKNKSVLDFTLGSSDFTGNEKEEFQSLHKQLKSLQKQCYNDGHFLLAILHPFKWTFSLI